MKRRIRPVKPLAGVDLIYLPVNAQGWIDIILRVTFKTYGSQVLRPGYLLSGDIDSRHPGIGARNPQGSWGGIVVCHVRVVAILALHVRADPTCRKVLGRIMDACEILHEVSILLGELIRNIGSRHIAVMTGQTRFLLKEMT